MYKKLLYIIILITFLFSQECPPNDTIPILPNRLTYPELFHIKSNPNFFYETDENLGSKLMELIQNHGSINTNKLSELACKFDWGIIATKYDSLILKAYENKK